MITGARVYPGATGEGAPRARDDRRARRQDRGDRPARRDGATRGTGDRRRRQGGRRRFLELPRPLHRAQVVQRRRAGRGGHGAAPARHGHQPRLHVGGRYRLRPCQHHPPAQADRGRRAGSADRPRRRELRRREGIARLPRSEAARGHDSGAGAALDQGGARPGRGPHQDLHRVLRRHRSSGVDAAAGRPGRHHRGAPPGQAGVRASADARRRAARDRRRRRRAGSHRAAGRCVVAGDWSRAWSERHELDPDAQAVAVRADAHEGAAGRHRSRAGNRGEAARRLRQGRRRRPVRHRPRLHDRLRPHRGVPAHGRSRVELRPDPRRAHRQSGPQVRRRSRRAERSRWGRRRIWWSWAPTRRSESRASPTCATPSARVA